MKIVSYTMINNEANVIESFVRYNIAFIDEMIFIDNGCTDNSIPILRALISEGLNIKIFDESLQPLNLSYIENKYIKIAIEAEKADLVIPLDADEYISANINPRIALESLDMNCIHYIYWKWFVMTENDDSNELFIPQRMQYRISKFAWNYADGTPVTKVLIPANYFINQKLRVSAGHHTVYGNNEFKINNNTEIFQAHYRGTSDIQLLEKLYCYTMRDISAMNNNFETAQRTNQKSIIDSKKFEIHKAAMDASYGGYPKDIVKDPIDLKWLPKESFQIKYRELSEQKLEDIVYGTGCEMAIKYYNLEREKKERAFLKPIIFWLDGVDGKGAVMPNPSNKLTYLTAMTNTRAYLTDYPEIRFLKANHRLILTGEWIKFMPCDYIVIPDTVDYESVKEKIVSMGINKKILSWSDYKSQIGFLKSTWCKVGIISGMLENIRLNMKQNGWKHTKQRIVYKLKGK